MYPKLRRIPFLLLTLLSCSIVFAQQRTISGTVMNRENHEPLQGATVAIKGTDRVTTTNDQGHFSIVASDESVLKITMVGYVYEEIPVGKQTTININLVSDNKKMDEVVVIGYGTQKKPHTTGSIVTLDSKKIEDLPVGSLSEALKGQLVGVNVSGGFARPGQPATITIRNPIFYSKDGTGKDPIYVIDDIIRTKADFDLLDATEIENISVLKDAAAAIYGILGANGAIIVKTKRGKVGASSITYNASVGMSDAPFMPKMMTGYQQAAYINDYLYGSKNWDTTATQALAGFYTPDELSYFYNQKDNNWLKQAWQKSYETRHALNISGGSDKATYFAGLTYSSQNSNFSGARFNRYSFRSSSDIKLTTGLKLGLSLSGNLSDLKNTFNKQGNESLDNDWKTLLTQSQFDPPYINGLPILIQGAGTSSNINTYHYFAVHDLNNYTSSYNTSINFQGQLSYDFSFIKGLKASVNFNKNIASTFGKQYGTKYQVYDFNKLGNHSHILGDSVIKTYTWSNGDRVRLNPTISRTYQLTGTLNYDRTFGNHTIGLLAGYEQAEAFADGVAGQVDGVVVGGLDNQNFAVGTSTNPDGSSNETISEAGRLAYFGRLDYNYASKYLLQVQFRADASQNFAPENRWGYFPSFSAGWVISQEPFFSRALDAVNYLKIRGSVGFLGIDNTKSYQWLRSYAIQTGKAAVFNGNNDRGLAVVSNTDLANRNVHWDNQDKYDVGIDANFLKNRLSLSADYYFNRGYDMLTSLTLAPSILIGTPIPTENHNKANYFGYEVSANWKDNIGKDWSYNVTANFSWADNKQVVVDFPVGLAGTYLDPTGKSSDMGYKGYHYLGMFRSQADVDAYVAKYHITSMLGTPVSQLHPGMLYYADVRGPQDPSGKFTGPDGKVDANDMDFLSKKTDNHYGLGLNWGVAYKTLSLNVIMGMSWGGLNAVEGNAINPATAYSNRPEFWYDHWSPANPDAKYPSPYYSSTYNVPSDFWTVSSFTFRVTTFNLAYTLPRDLVRRAGFNSARLYLTGVNPINFYNPFSYKDNANGSYDVFPQLRSFSLGLNVNL